MNKKISIAFEKDPQYKLVHVHGVWGGVSPTGDIVADLYIERIKPPEEVLVELDPELGPREIERKGERHVRIMMAGLVLRPDIAYAIGSWLMGKAKAAGFAPPEEAERH